MNQDALKKPFFAQLLEAQKRTAEPAAESYFDLDAIVTKPFLDVEHTLKYPSDGDET